MSGQMTPACTDPQNNEAVQPPCLTERQHEVLELLSDGLTIQAIARRLTLSPRTVGKHLERVYRRLGTSDRLMTVMRAQRYGLLAGRTAVGDDR